MRKLLSFTLHLSLFTLSLLPAHAGDDDWWNSEEYVRHELLLLDPDWQHIWSQYSGNGSLMVQVYDGERRLESYECAVYDKNGEQRECKSSLADAGHGLGWCTLTIHGNATEEVYFRIVYEDASGATQVSEARETYLYYNNCDDLIGRLLPDGTIDPASVLTLHISNEPYARCTLADGSTYEFSASTLTDDVKALLPTTCAMQFGGKWTASQLSALHAVLAAAATNPNCLYYFPSQVSVPAYWPHAIQGGKALTDITLTDGSTPPFRPFRCPATFSLDGHCASYTRSWPLADGFSGWSTVVVPFLARVAASTSLGGTSVLQPFSSLSPTLAEWARGEGYWLCEVKYANDADGIVGTTDVIAGTLEPDSPYLIAFPGPYFRGTYDGKDYSLDMTGRTITLESINAADDKIYATPDRLIGQWQQTAKDDYTFQGTYRTLMKQPLWLLRSRVTADGCDAFVAYEEGNLQPFRAYLSVADASALTQGAVLPLNMEWESDGVSTPWAVNCKQSAAIYDLSGRPLSAPRAGIILRSDGRKEVVR